MKKDFRGKNIVITGASGFIGSKLSKELIKLGANVHALIDQNSSMHRIKDIQENIIIHKIKKWDQGALEKLFNNINPNIIFHLRAAINPASGQEAQKNFFLQVNFKQTKELVNASFKFNLESFVNTGTIAEYGATSTPFKENKKAEPISEYGETKLAATKWIQSFSQKSNFPAVLIRSSVVYGPGQTPYSYLVPNVIMSCLKGEDFHIPSSGLQTRDPLFVDDDVQGLIAAAVSPKAKSEIINLGLGKEYTVVGIARIVNNQFGNPINITTGSKIDRPGENKNYW
ncbi:MAG: SDR family NAD(P)-dependent oxidoreductase, partial [Candidatus Zapsychrus exili]|nr:SDR family NAD(P)-dependent oxidoreductase [Candidatus Zapsychrus exili]